MKEELKPFKYLIDKGIPSIMTGHMALPLITGDDTPCSLSRGITTGLLKEELGFEGVVVTDCLEMDAIAEPGQGGCGVPDGAARALGAGADVVMICHTFDEQRRAVERVWRGIEMQEISVQKLRESGERIVKMKDRFAGSWNEVLGKSDPGWETEYGSLHARNLELSREAYLRTTTVGGGKSVIPLNANVLNGHLLLFTPAIEAVNRAVDSGDGVLRGPDGIIRNTAGASYLALARSLEARVKVKHIVFGAQDSIPGDILGGAGAVLFVMRNADLKLWQLDYLERLHLDEARVPVILMSSCGPYDLAGGRYDGLGGYIVTYEFTAEAFESAVKVMFGEGKGGGKLPVNLI
jgi:beta-N-acetylhexosaminidase